MPKLRKGKMPDYLDYRALISNVDFKKINEQLRALCKASDDKNDPLEEKNLREQASQELYLYEYRRHRKQADPSVDLSSVQLRALMMSI